MSKQQGINLWHVHNTCEHIPNEETLEAFAETEEIVRKLRAGEYVKTYSSAREMLDEMLAEIDEELRLGIDD